LEAFSGLNWGSVGAIERLQLQKASGCLKASLLQVTVKVSPGDRGMADLTSCCEHSAGQRPVRR
jgi:hypothetical protein